MIEIGNKGKITIIWEVLPINYTDESVKNIIEVFSKKYGVSKDNVKVEPNFIKINKNGVEGNLTDNIIQNIHDPKFQHTLFKSYIEENNIIDCDYEKILNIDGSINNLIDFGSYDKYCKYQIKWLSWSNFLSYGEDNYFDFSDLRGLTLLNGSPSNQTGKSTFAYDLLHFLLFGKTNSGKADVLNKIFNKYQPEATNVKIEGCIHIKGSDYVIKRILTRPSLTKRSEKSKVTHKVQYFKVVEGFEEELVDIDNEEGYNNTNTNAIIKESIGNERDFDLVICANSDNLKSLISLKETDRGRLLSKWIGLIVLEEKDVIAREKFNKEISPTLLSNKYNRLTLDAEINDLRVTIDNDNNKIKESDKTITLSEEKLCNFKKMFETLLLSKRDVDENLLKIDVTTITRQQNNIIERGKVKRAEKEKNKNRLDVIGNVMFSEIEYNNLIETDKIYAIKINDIKRDISDLEKTNTNLKTKEICPTCGKKFDGVDFTASINENIIKIKSLTTELNNLYGSQKNNSEQINAQAQNRDLYNEKNRLLILIEKNEVDLDIITKDYRETVRVMKDLDDNKAAIENNNRIELELQNVKININKEETYKRELVRYAEELKQCVIHNTKLIEERKNIILKINEEESLIKNWKLYLEMIGKNGISKVILKNTLPIINGELKRLLNDVTDFDVEVIMNQKNEVAFNLIKDGVSDSLSSGSGLEQTAAALALRVVLGNISTMPRPNFIVFDEVLGGVAKENYDKIKLLYDRISENYSFILQITHIEDIVDWHTNIITVQKTDNVSCLNNRKKII